MTLVCTLSSSRLGNHRFATRHNFALSLTHKFLASGLRHFATFDQVFFLTYSAKYLSLRSWYTRFGSEIFIVRFAEKCLMSSRIRMPIRSKRNISVDGELFATRALGREWVILC